MSLHGAQSQLGLPDLRLIQALGEAGSLAAAARRLGIDHSSAYRRLGALEARLGVRLFERSRDGYAPTVPGELAIAAGGRLLGELAALERRLAGEDVRPSGTVRVTTAETLVPLLMPVVAAFRAAQPGIMLELVTSNSFFTLTRRDADVALRPAVAAPEGLVARRLAGIAAALYAAPAWVSDGEPLATFDWVAPDDTLSHLGSARWIAATIPPERIVFRASSLSALQLAARAGLGIAALPCFIGDADAELVRVSPPVAEMASALWLITHPDLRRVTRVRAFLDFAASGFAGHRALLEGRTPHVPDGPATVEQA